MDKNGYNPSLFPTDYCLLCGRYGDLARHEVFHGNRRQTAKKFGCWVNLCPDCHNKVHSHPVINNGLEKMMQAKAMQVYGWTEEDFRAVFGKNYL